MITKEDLKHEIEQLDDSYLDLVFRLLQQFPHKTQKPRVFGQHRGLGEISDDFNDELSNDFWLGSEI